MADDKKKNTTWKEALSNINKTGTVSGQSSGVSNISGKIVNTNTNTSNLAGVNYRSSTPTTKVSSGPTGINTNTSNLAGVNYKTSTPTQKTVKSDFTSSSAGSSTNTSSAPRNLGISGAFISNTNNNTNNKSKTSSQSNSGLFDVSKSSNKYKDNYTVEDRDALGYKLEEKLNDPLSNEDVMYKDMWSDEKKDAFQKNQQEIKDTAKEYQVAQTQVGLKKKKEDSNPEGDLDEIKDVVTQNNGNYELIDYKTDYKKAEAEKERLQKELDALYDERGKYTQTIENAGVIAGLNARIVNIEKQLRERVAELNEIGRRADFQDAVLGEWTLEDAKKNNDEQVLKQLYDTYESYDDSFIERRLENTAKIAVDMASTVTSTVDILRDLGGEALAKTLEEDAKRLLETGQISNEEFNNIISRAKMYADFDATSENNLSTLLRNQSNLIAYQIQNGEDGVGAFIGQGLDSTANFLALFLLYGEAGSLALMSGQSGSQKYFENLEKGYSKETALLNGLATGLTSYMTERIGMDNFVSILNGTAGKGVMAQALNSAIRGDGPLAFWAQSVISQGMAEGLEEVVEGNVDFILDSITAKIANGEPIEYNAGDLFYSFLVGSFSGALMGGGAGTYNIAVNTREQYNNLKHDVNALANMRQEAISKGEDVTALDNAIRLGNEALAGYEAKSQTMGVTFAGEDIDTTLPQSEIDSELTEAIRPNADQEVRTTLDKEALVENVTKMSQDFLTMKGINMDANEFVQLDEEARENVCNVQEYADKLNVNIAFSSNVDGDGYFDPETKQIVVNPNSKLGELSTMVHEFTHFNEASGFYETLAKLVSQSFNGDEAKALATIKDVYKKHGVKLDDNYAKREFVAINVQQMLGNQEFVDKLVRYNNSLAYRMFKNVQAMFNGDVKSQLENTFMKAFQDAQTVDTANTIIQHSINDDILIPNQDILDTNYSDDELWMNNKDEHRVLNTEMSIKEFVDKYSSSDENYTLWLGKLNSAFINKVMADTGINLNGKSLTLSSSSITHVGKRHGVDYYKIQGNPTPITIKELENLAHILNTYDRVDYVPNTDGQGYRFSFETDADKGYTYDTVELNTSRGKELRLKTLYTFRGTKKGTNRVANVVNTTTPTSTSSLLADGSLGVPDINISNPVDFVNETEGRSDATFDDNGNVLNADGFANDAEQDVQKDAFISSEEGSAFKQYSLGTWLETDQEKVVSDLVDTLGVSKDKASKWVKDVNSVAKVIADNKALLDYESNPNYSSMKSNDEYVASMDMSTLCKKRAVLQGTIDEIQKRLPDYDIDGQEYTKIRQMMKDRGYEVACGFCYVESRRKELGKVAKNFIDSRNYDGLTIYDLTTVNGVAELQRTNPEIYEDFVKFNNKRGSGKVNLVQSRTEYRGEIINKLTDGQIEKILRIGGLRLQSYSDFETPHLIDTMQIVLDMSRRGLTSQAYTKVPDFADAFGKTGIKINLSLVCKGVDSKGKLIFDDIEGMPHNEAFKLRNKYSENVGTILVGKDDETIISAMADPRIDYIIPFHRSGWGKAEYAALGIEGYTDYTDFQKEYWVTPKQVTQKNGKVVTENAPTNQFYPIDYWDYTKSGKENAETYLRLCAEDGRIPKFANFLVDNGDGSWSLQPDGSTDGYWKMLIDFKMYDNNGVGAPQQPVQPIFDNRINQRILKKYSGDHAKNRFAPEVVNEFVKAVSNTQHSFGVDLSESEKQKQFDLIQETNPRDESLGNHTWANSTNDIRTFEEVINNDDVAYTPDFTEEDAENVFDSGTVTVYSSKPIENGVFVTPSKMEAQAYAGNGQVYSKTINPYDVAWIDSLQGQYAKTRQDNEFVSRNILDYRSLREVPREVAEKMYNQDIEEGLDMPFEDYLDYVEPDSLDGDYADRWNKELRKIATPKGETSSIDDIQAKLNETIDDSSLPVKFYNRLHTYALTKDINEPYRITEFNDGEPVKHTTFDSLQKALHNLSVKLSDYGYENYSVQNLNNENTRQYSKGVRLDDNLPSADVTNTDVGGPNGPTRIEGEVVDGYGDERTQRFASSNIPKSAIFNEEQKEQVRQEIERGEFTYVGLTNKVEVQRAREYMERDGIDATYDKFMSNNNPNAKSVVQGEVLLQELAKAKDPRWHDVAVKMADDATIAGQFLQAYAIMQRLTPQGQLAAIQRNLSRMQSKLDSKYGNKAPQLELKPELVEELQNAKTPEEAQGAKDRILEDLIKQQPITFSDMFDSWRYLSMLGNPRTHIRNILGNAFFMPVIGLKNAIGTGLEKAVDVGLQKTTGKKLDYKTKSFVSRLNPNDRVLYKAGQEAYNNYRKIIESTQKYEQRGFSENTMLGKALNKADQFNSWLLDNEDFLFSKDRYALSYAQFLKANNLTPENISPEMSKRANDYALNEALKATYRDANALADWFNELETNDKLKWAGYAKKAILPFTKTPFNIVKRGVRYSGLGLLESITYGAYQVKNGKLDVNTWLDQLASGLSGTAIMGLGYLLAKMGIFRTKDDDKDRKKYFDQENGEQDYAIDLGPGTLTIDWMSPVIMPLAMGAELGSVFEELEQIDGAESALNSLLKISANIMDPIVETSMLSSLQDAMSSYSNEGGAYFGDVVSSAVASYIGQMFPTIGGQVARTIDDTRRTTSPNKGLIDKTWKQIKNKIPFASRTNQPFINKQGQEEKNEDLGMGWAGRAFLNMFSPGYYSSKDIDEYDEELYRLYDETGDINSLPSSTSKSVSFEGENIKFGDEEYTQWHKTRYATESRYVNEFIDSKAYQSLTDEERVETIKDIREYAQKVAKQEFLESQGIEYTDRQLTNAQGAMDNGIELYSYYDYLNNAGTKQAEKIAYLEGSGLSEKQKEYLWGLNDYKTSYKDAYAKIMKESNSKSSKKKSSKKSSKTGSAKKKKVTVGSATKTKVSTSSGGKGSVKKIAPTSYSAGKEQILNTKNNNYLKSYSKVMNRKPSAGASSNTKVCPNCGAKIPVNYTRCPVCGKAV